MAVIRAVHFLILVALPLALQARRATTVVVDSVSGAPLSKASIFDRKGNLIGVCADNGALPFIFDEVYPLTIKYMGYNAATVASPGCDTVRMCETVYALPEVVVNSKAREVLHITGYLREYSTLTSYTDTVTLFREKTVDFMVPSKSAGHYRGWLNPRPLAVKSYYRFSSGGTDSVSDYFSRHFSWSDWVGVPGEAYLPLGLREDADASETVQGRYGVASRWRKAGDDILVDVDVLADTTNRKWVPAIASYMHGQAEFDKFNIRYKFADAGSPVLRAGDLAGMAFNIESTGRGRSMFRLFKKDEPFFVSTYAELYITDREYMTVKQARKLEKNPPKFDEAGINVPDEAPELLPATQELIARVEGIDHTKRRMQIQSDQRLAGIKDLFRTRRSAWQQFMDIISPPRYQINVGTFPNLR